MDFSLCPGRRNSFLRPNAIAKTSLSCPDDWDTMKKRSVQAPPGGAPDKKTPRPARTQAGAYVRLKTAGEWLSLLRRLDLFQIGIVIREYTLSFKTISSHMVLHKIHNVTAAISVRRLLHKVLRQMQAVIVIGKRNSINNSVILKFKTDIVIPKKTVSSRVSTAPKISMRAA